MENKWDGKTKGSLWGYKFFVFCIRFMGLRISYFFCFWVSGYFILFSKKHRSALMQFYQIGFGYSKWKSLKTAAHNFYLFGQVLIDRIALKTKRKSSFTHHFTNEAALKSLIETGKGGFLLSAHLGNWENAGNLIGERITQKINILMLDAEVEKIKQYLEETTEKSQYNLIPIKNDMSHLILIHQALKRNELIALHADRIADSQKTFEFPFLNGKAKFPAGPFIMAHKFKVPITFVYAVKESARHYALSATNPINNSESAEQIAQLYVSELEQKVKENPAQWFNFYEYYAS